MPKVLFKLFGVRRFGGSTKGQTIRPLTGPGQLLPLRKRHLVWLVIVPFFLPAPAMLAAVHKTWNGGNDAWSNPAAWTPAGVPDAADEVEINAGGVALNVPITLSNLLVWTGGSLYSGTLRVATGAVIRVTGDGAKTLNSATLTSAGRMEIDGAGALNLLVTGYGQSTWVTNEAGGVLEWSGAANMAQINGGWPTSLGLVNAGVLRKTGSGTNSMISVPLNNQGTVEVQAGLLSQSGGGSSSGRFKIAQNAAMDIQAAVYSLEGSVWEGPGPVRLIGSATLNGTFIATNFVLAGGNVTGVFDVSGGFTWTGGMLTSAIGRLGVGNHRIEGTADKVLNHATLANAGSLVVEDTTVGFLVTGNGQRIYMTNESGGVMDLRGAVTLDQRNGGWPVALGWYNEGTLLSSASGTNNIANIPLHNRGGIEVLAGVLRQTGGGTSPGQFRVAEAARFEFAQSTYDFGGSRWFGPGPSLLVGDAALNGTFIATNFVLAGGNVSGVFDVSGGFRWTGGMLTSAIGRLGVGNHRIEGTADKVLNHATLANAGSLVVEDTTVGFLVTGNGQRIYMTNEFGGVMDLRGAVTLEQRNGGWPAALGLYNEGTLLSSASGTNTIANIPLHNRGRLEVQAGLLSQSGGGVSSGRFAVAQGAAMDMQAAVYTLDGSVWEGPGPGRVVGSTTVNGTFTATNFVLAGGNVTGVFDVSGAFRWTGGWLTSAQVHLGLGNHRIEGVADKALNHVTLANAGNLVIEDAALGFTVTGGGQRIFMTNEPSGVIELRGAVKLEQRNPGYSTPMYLDSYGTIRSTASGTNSVVSIPLHNRGGLEVLAGVLSQTGGGTSPGQFRVAEGARFEFAQSVYDFGGSRWFGPGPGLVVGDTSVNGTFIATNFVVAGGYVSGVFDASGAFRWTGGWLTSAQVHLGLGNHRIEGVADKALNHATLANAGNLVIEDATLGFTVTGGGQRIFMTNELSGVIDLRGAVKLEQRNPGYSAPMYLDSYGTIRSTASGTNSVVSIPLHNRGTLEVLGGVLKQNGGGTSPGQFRMADGARFEFDGGVYEFAGSRWFGPGSGMVVNHATVNGAFDAENFILANGNLSGVFGINGGFKWTGGWLSSALVRLGPGNHRIEGTANKALNHATLTNAGVLVLDNAALGFTVTGGGQTCVLTNEPSGRLDLVGNAVIEQRNPGYGAILAMRNGGQLRKLGEGTSTVAGLPLYSGGACDIQQGSLQVESLALGPGAETTVPVPGIAPLRVVGAAQLAGTLKTRALANQGFTNTTRFEAIRAASIAGTFANTVASNPGDLFEYNIGYTPQTVTLTTHPAATIPVQFAEVKIDNGRFKIQLNAQGSFNYIVEVSTNLTNWATLLITNATAGAVTLEDPGLALDPQRFYRLGIFQ